MEKKARFSKCTVNQTDLAHLIGSLLLAVLNVTSQLHKDLSWFYSSCIKFRDILE